MMDFYVKTTDYIGTKKYASVKYRFDRDQLYSAMWEMNKNEVAIRDENKYKELPFIFTQMKMASTFTIQFFDAADDQMTYFFDVANATKMLARVLTDC